MSRERVRVKMTAQRHRLHGEKGATSDVSDIGRKSSIKSEIAVREDHEAGDYLAHSPDPVSKVTER